MERHDGTSGCRRKVFDIALQILNEDQRSLAALAGGKLLFLEEGVEGRASDAGQLDRFGDSHRKLGHSG